MVIHTNLGRAPIPESVFDAMKDTLSGYTNLEMSLESGKRGGRIRGVTDRLCALVGAKMPLWSTTMQLLFCWPSVQLLKVERLWCLVENLWRSVVPFAFPILLRQVVLILWKWEQPIARVWVITLPHR